MSDTPETDKAERMAFAQEYMVPTEFARKLERERDEAREALRKAIRFVEAFEPCSRGTEVDQNETLAIARKALEEAK